MPDLSALLQQMLYQPQYDPATTKSLRGQFAGNPAMQQKLAIEDRYHQGEDLVQNSPLGAVGTLAATVPYDLAKLAYFNGPAPVKNVLGKVTAGLFPGEGFNDQTTSRPDIRQYGGLISGMLHGWQRPRVR